MNKGKKKHYQNRSPLAFSLTVLFVMLTALCPIKRIFFSSASTPSLHQRAKITPEKQSPDLQELKSVPAGLCGLSYVTFKQSTNNNPPTVDFIAAAMLVLTVLLFKIFPRCIKTIPISANHYTLSTPIFIRNQLLLI